MVRAVLVPIWMAAILIALTLAVASPAISQDTADPLQGLTANVVEGPDDDRKADRITIAVADCQVAADATITVEDAQDTGEVFTNSDTGTGVDATITPEDNAIVVDGISKDEVAGNFGEEGATDRGTVTGSTGIQCGTDRNVDDDGTADPDEGQYGDKDADDAGDVDDPDDVVGTVKDKPLPKTGGVSLLFGAGALLLSAALVSRRILAP